MVENPSGQPGQFTIDDTTYTYDEKGHITSKQIQCDDASQINYRFEYANNDNMILKSEGMSYDVEAGDTESCKSFEVITKYNNNGQSYETVYKNVFTKYTETISLDSEGRGTYTKTSPEGKVLEKHYAHMKDGVIDID